MKKLYFGILYSLGIYLLLGTHLLAAVPSLPTNTSPGTSSSPGPVVSSTRVTLDWNPSSGASYYDLGVTDMSTGNLVVDTQTTSTSKTVTLTAGRTYRWNVAAGNSSGLSSYTTRLYFQTPGSRPATPTNTSPGTTSSPGPVMSSTSVTLDWNASSGATYYELGVTDMSTGNLVVDTQTSSTSKTVTLTAGRTYRWNVAAGNSSGLSSYTTRLYFQTPGSRPATPTNTSPGTTSSPGPVMSSTSLTLDWNASSGATYYELGVTDMSTGNLVVDTQTSSTSKTVTLTAGRTYRWNVAAGNSSGLSSYTTRLYFQTPGSRPATPTNTSPGTTSSPGPVMSSTSVTLDWNASSGATYYELGVTDMSTGNLVVDTQTSSTSKTVTLTAGRTYRWNVAAGNSSGLSSYTTRLYFQTPGSRPATPTNTSPGTTSSPGPVMSSTSVTLDWNASSGATYYELGVTDMSTGNLVVDTQTSSTSKTVTLTAGRTYRWNVAAGNSSGLSSYTTRLYFQTPIGSGQPPTLSFRFPLANYTPYTAPVSSVFDHSGSRYIANDKVIVYTGETGSIRDLSEPPVNTSGGMLYSYKKSDSTVFRCNGNYQGTQLTGASTINYDGHPGWDYAVPIGTQVFAVADGQVVLATSSTDSGKYIRLQHGQDYQSQYLHLSEQLVSEGDTVTKGQLIGKSGNSGGVAAHLHFEVKKKVFEGVWVSVDPYGWEGSGVDPYTAANNINLWEGAPVPSGDAPRIIQDFIPKGRSNRPGYPLSVTYITIHDTGNVNSGADAAMHASYLKGQVANDKQVSWHFTVDDQEIYQHLPVNENGWHAGDGENGVGNRKSIGVEICMNDDGNRMQAEENAAWLVAKLLRDHGLKISSLRQHNDWSGKDCPIILRHRLGGWDGFVAKVQAFMDTGESEPQIVVSGNSKNISNGDSSPSTTDGTDFGSVNYASGSVSRTFRVSNTGGSTLTLGTETSSNDQFTVNGLKSSISGGSYDDFTVVFDPGSAGTKTATISFTTNDSDENPFNFTVSGEGIAPPPENAVSGNGNNISDGDSSPVATDGTDFGSVNYVNGSVIRTFRVDNTGGSTLTLGTVTSNDSEFVVSGLASSIPPDGSDTFTIIFNPDSVGTKQANISFSTNVSNKNPFNFVVRGVGAVTLGTPATFSTAVTYKMELPTSFENAPKVKEKGLPKGLKLDKKTGMISGVPSAAGSFEVVVSAPGMETETMILTIDSLPEWAMGSFSGWVDTEEHGPGTVEMNISSNGRIAGRLLFNGSSYSFKEASYFERASDGSYRIHTEAGKGKESFSVSFSVYPPSDNGDGVDQLSTVEGTLFSPYAGSAELFRRIWDDTGAETILEPYIGYYTAALPGSDGFGSGYLTFTIDEKGRVRTAGSLADGTKVSASGSLIYDPDGKTWIPLYCSPKSYEGGSFFGIIEFEEVGSTVAIQPLDSLDLLWQSYSETATETYGEGFYRLLGIEGGWYDQLVNLQNAYAEGLVVYEVELPVFVAKVKYPDGNRLEEVSGVSEASPEGLVLAASTKGLSAPKSDKVLRDKASNTYDFATDTNQDGEINTSALSFKVKSSTGIFSAKFNAWYTYDANRTSDKDAEKLKKQSVKVQGVLLPVQESPEELVPGSGYYLWKDVGSSDSGKGYKFNRSFDFLLLDPLED